MEANEGTRNYAFARFLTQMSLKSSVNAVIVSKSADSTYRRDQLGVTRGYKMTALVRLSTYVAQSRPTCIRLEASAGISVDSSGEFRCIPRMMNLPRAGDTIQDPIRRER